MQCHVTSVVALQVELCEAALRKIEPRRAELLAYVATAVRQTPLGKVAEPSRLVRTVDHEVARWIVEIKTEVRLPQYLPRSTCCCPSLPLNAIFAD
jgi:hypothetical protein